MRHTPHFLMTEPAEVKRLIRQNPWATFVSHTAAGLVASHYPVLLDEGRDDISILSHFGRPDDITHELGQHEVLVIIQGPHDYVSPSWYEEGDVVATWNHVTAHLYGVPEILSEEAHYQALSHLTDHFESQYPDGRSLAQDEERTRRLAKGAVGVRLTVTRFDARAKLSQNKKPQVVDRIVEEFESRHPSLGAEMRRISARHDSAS